MGSVWRQVPNARALRMGKIASNTIAIGHRLLMLASLSLCIDSNICQKRIIQLIAVFLTFGVMLCVTHFAYDLTMKQL